METKEFTILQVVEKVHQISKISKLKKIITFCNSEKWEKNVIATKIGF
jgi:hypothetical protein